MAHNKSNTVSGVDSLYRDKTQLERMIKQETKLRMGERKELSKYSEYLTHGEIETEAEQRRRLRKEAHEYNIKSLIEEGKYAEAIADKFKNSSELLQMAGTAASNITHALDNTIREYVSAQQKMSAHLVGTGYSLASITDNLHNALSTSNLVRQEAVYKNLQKLLTEGIVNNSEQRAFLQTISDDLGMVFDATNGSLTRLIRIQQQDLSANRLAIEYSLQEFLNQNYQTSEYIRNGYTNVSNAILEAQSLMNANQAVQLETVIQTWMGSLYSSGISDNTVTGLASALNDLGSGNIDNLGSGLANLVLMGVARAGLDYGDLLNRGISSNDVNTIMSGISSYMGDMGANSSNVVKSQLSKLFGVSISDLAAIQNFNYNPSGAVSSNIGGVFGDYNQLVPFAVELENMYQNMMYTWGTNIASNDGMLAAYKSSNLISNALGTLLNGVEADVFGLEVNLGALARTAPLFPLITSLIPTLGDMGTSFISGANSIGSMYDSLFRAGTGSTVKMSGQGVSGSMYVGNTDTSSLLGTSLNSVSSIATSAYQGDEVTMEDNIATMTSNSTEILNLLDTYLGGIHSALDTMSITLSTMSSISPMTYITSPIGL